MSKNNKNAAENADENNSSVTESNASAEEKQVDPEKARKKAMRRRRLKYGGTATAITVIVIAIVVMVNVVLEVLSDRMDMTIDITANGTFEISQESIDYLNTLNEDVEIVCMTDELEFSSSNYVYFKQAYEVLKKYTYNSGHVKLKFVDMTVDPTYVNRYSEMYKGDITQYSIVVSTDKRIKVLTVQDLYNVEMNQYYQQEIKSSKAEQELTSAIMYVTDPDPLNAVMFNTESEAASYSNIYNILDSNGYAVSEINPLIDAIPEDTDVIVVCAPMNDYDEELVQKLYDFLDNGGELGKNLIYVADFSQKSTTNIDALLREWGIEVAPGVVGDSNSANTSSASSFVIGSFIDTNENAYAENVSDTSLPVISYYSRPIHLLFEEKDNRSAYSLVTTDDTAFVQTIEGEGEEAQAFDPVYGSVSTMAVASKLAFNSNNEQVKSNVLVVGSTYMLDQSITEMTYYNNGDYFVSALNTMTGKTSGISIVAKDLTTATFQMDEKTFNICRTVFMLVIPLTVVVIGVGVHLRRRRL